MQSPKRSSSHFLFHTCWLKTRLTTQRSYEIYTKDAVFHYPVGIARGVDSIRAQFDTLPKVCVLVTRDSVTQNTTAQYTSPHLAFSPHRNTKPPRVTEPDRNACQRSPYRSGRRIFPRRQGRFAVQG